MYITKKPVVQYSVMFFLESDSCIPEEFRQAFPRFGSIVAVNTGNFVYRGAHVFRHAFATNCYYKHVDVKVLSRLLGHSDIRVTMNVYVNLHDDGFDEMYAAVTA